MNDIQLKSIDRKTGVVTCTIYIDGLPNEQKFKTMKDALHTGSYIAVNNGILTEEDIDKWLEARGFIVWRML